MSRGLLAFLVLTTSLIAAERSPELFALDFARANGLAEAGKRPEAIALYESLVAEQPKNGGLNFHYGNALYMCSTVPELPAKEATQLRLRARAALLAAQAAGFQDPLLDQLLVAIKADGSITKPKFSNTAAVDAAMHEAEAAFAKHDMEAAFAAYQRALKLDPNLYSAALFSGDCRFVAGKLDEAIVWFRRATEIDPHQEMAYRYWADALAKQGKVREALVQLAEALVANPYTGYAWRTTKLIAEPAGRLRKLPAMKLPVARIDPDAKTGKAGIALPEKFTPLDLVYGAGRAKWVDQEFAREYPGATYRHSLPEELAGLTTLLTIVQEIGSKGDTPPDYAKSLADHRDTVERLKTLKEEGLLEAFVLFFCADEGIVQDYPAYRDAHRDKLREFVRRYMVNVD